MMMTNKPQRDGFAWLLGLSALFLLVTVAGFISWDQPALEAVRSGFAAGLVGLARALSRYGDFPYLLGAAAILLVVSFRWGKRKLVGILVAMILGSIVAGLFSNVIKLGTGRVRPRVEQIEHGWYGPRFEDKWVSVRHDYQAFPSSHAACAFGFFAPLFFASRWWGASGLLLAAAIAWSRVQLNAHHISDVAAGALIGVVIGWLSWRWIVQRGVLSRWLGNA